ncbi:hypothetical protein [Pelagovum pacificum]|uniref:Uncharacterized protein n=1 Tax=Pelagovum pacificum TaxID=2588711 RepID=A0A5C5GD36_9RHOB|nr:hypothetical protein [Pelagovum pacificum]QQA44290.1 hypothetical protein I8N54_06855 [Pelagovum pacificum]TNY32588.1 hypothetical protein FHY64_04710 [Pelagovum pacificum]
MREYHPLDVRYRPKARPGGDQRIRIGNPRALPGSRSRETAAVSPKQSPWGRPETGPRPAPIPQPAPTTARRSSRERAIRVLRFLWRLVIVVTVVYVALQLA